MANSVPALLAKVVRLRPSVVCFVGKGIWLHVERSFQLRTGHGDRDNDTGASARGLVARASETCEAMKEEERDDLVGCAPAVSAEARPRQVKTETELVTGFERPGKELEGGDVTRRHPLAVQDVKGALDAPLMGTGPRSASMPRRATARSVFAYGLQPYKALHDVVPKVRENILPYAFLEIFV